jgi:GH15 family glucan-1,4-alpha-glucosidase
MRGRAAAAIGDYGFLSDCHSAVLVDRAGSVDWWCPPRFDGPSVFGRVLGREAGHWSLRPVADFDVARSYLADTLVLCTEFTTATGQAMVTDALGLELGARGHDLGVRSPHVLLRRVEVSRGHVEMKTDFAPRVEYGLTVPHVTACPGGVEARGGPVRLTLTGPIDLSPGGGRARGRFTVRAGEAVELRLAWARAADPGRTRRTARPTVEDTVDAWRSWAALHDGYDGRHRDAVRRARSCSRA